MQWVKGKYSKSYSNNVLNYCKRYGHLINSSNSNLREIELLPNYTKNQVIASLTVLSKFNGTYEQFKGKLKANGVKSARPNSLDAFLRILNATDSDILDYYKKIQPILRSNEQLYIKFLLRTGLRVSEAIHSFNLVIELASNGRLNEYYNEDWSVLQHFKYQNLFIRGNKNCYLSFVSKDFLMQIAKSKPVTYHALHKRLSYKKQPMRFDEFRDFFGTHLINNGILEVEQNLLCGRIPVSVFVRHYWSPKLKELGTRIFKALESIEQ